MLDHDALSFSLVPFCYGVCPFVNQLHPLPSATSGIPGYTKHGDAHITVTPATDYPRASRSFSRPRIAGSGNEIGKVETPHGLFLGAIF
jgi:hypothetical protein